MFFGEPGPWFNQLDMDGDKTSVFHDVDGSVSEYPGSYLTKADNWLVRHPDCIDVPDWRGAVCSGRYAQVGHHGTAPRVPGPSPVRGARLEGDRLLCSFSFILFTFPPHPVGFLKRHSENILYAECLQRAIALRSPMWMQSRPRHLLMV